jgi:CRP-like cAMP-binding protein
MFNKDDVIIKEGEQGDWLYLVFSGSAVATKLIEG